MRGHRVAIIGNSGGPGILAADACVPAGLVLSKLSAATLRRLRRLVPDGVPIANPVDLLASAGPAEFAAAIAAMRDDDEVDAVVVIFTPTLIAEPAEVAAAVVEVAAGTEKPVVAAFITETDGLLTVPNADAQVPRFEAAEDAVFALGRVAGYSAWRSGPAGAVERLDVDTATVDEVIAATLTSAPAGRWLDADAANSLLRAYGIDAVTSVVVTNGAQAIDAARSIGYPVALKVASGDVVHKTDVGGVALGIGSDGELERAWKEMNTRLVGGLTKAVVQPMAPGGVEVIAGAVQDPMFGPLVMFGLGGTSAELLDDRVIRLAPVTVTDAAAMVRSLRASPLLFGYRGAAPVDSDALESLLRRVAQLVEDHAEIAELDLNPVVASADGAVVVDPKVRVAPAPARQPDVRRLAAPRP